MEKENETKPLQYFVVCQIHGKQTVPKSELQNWGQEIAQLLGKPLITANCPICHSTLEAHQENPPNQPKPSQKEQL